MFTRSPLYNIENGNAIPKITDYRETVEQINELIGYAIEHEIANFDKSEILKGITGIDIISAIRLNRDDLAAQKEE